MALIKSFLAGASGVVALLLVSPGPRVRTAEVQSVHVVQVRLSGPVTAEQWPALLAQGKRTGVIDLGDRQVVDMPRTIQSDAPLTIKGGRFGPTVLDSWRNVTLDGGRFSTGEGASEYTYLLVINDGQNVTVRNAHFSGYETPEGELRVRGPSVRGGHNITIERSTIEHLAGFSNFIRTDGARFADNDIRDIREGLEIQGAKNLVIERNRFERFRPFNGDHADAIQIFTTGLTHPEDTGARDIIIRDNLMLLGSKAQGIFCGDEIGLGAKGLGYARFLIENNIIIGAGWHGITVGWADGLIIRNNRLGRIARQDQFDSRIDVNGTNILVEGNEANDFIFRTGVKDRDNQKFGEVPARTVDAMVADWVKRFRPAA